ncbi:MAG: coenzyme F420-0:L-glutamate ligase [Pseudaminobacter sp.]|nr:coenzyme F420-0:L-glutamate ligase [Pseudaminobacter sp.]
MTSVAPVSFYALPGFPLVEPGDDLSALLARALRNSGLGLLDGDILVIAQKIVSKAEDRYINLDDVEPSQRARELAEKLGKDPRHVEIVLGESEEIVRVGEHVIIAAHKLGFVMANAGIDESNISHGENGRVLLLPRDPDGSAFEIKRRLDEEFGVSAGILINDSFGRPWRNGVVGVALGAAGLPALVDRVGSLDLFGRKLKVTEIGVADELASAASLLMGQADEGIPAVLVRGLRLAAPHRNAASLIRSRERDMFR